ncbi:MAG: single-stranded DNA-binding protein [Deltaproteobacteria bacterium]|jgi:single-strand DNA-binding protein|nr:single-stranded DNA-binding protein [Deltaproteobacteria bacterium]
MASVNKAILLGHLGQDPEYRTAKTGKKFVTFSLATSDRWNNEDRVEWHKIVLFERTAEVAKEYLRKGSQVYIEGRIQTRSWEDQQGIKRYTTEIIGNNLVILSRKDSYANQPTAPAPSPLANDLDQEPYEPPLAAQSVATQPVAAQAKVEPPKAPQPPVEPPKVEPPAVDPPQTTTPKVEAPKVEPPAAEPPQATAPQAAIPKVEPPAVEAVVEEIPDDETPPLPSDGDLPF